MAPHVQSDLSWNAGASRDPEHPQSHHSWLQSSAFVVHFLFASSHPRLEKLLHHNISIFNKNSPCAELLSLLPRALGSLWTDPVWNWCYYTQSWGLLMLFFMATIDGLAHSVLLTCLLLRTTRAISLLLSLCWYGAAVPIKTKTKNTILDKCEVICCGPTPDSYFIPATNHFPWWIKHSHLPAANNQLPMIFIGQSLVCWLICSQVMTSGWNINY